MSNKWRKAAGIVLTAAVLGGAVPVSAAEGTVQQQAVQAQGLTQEQAIQRGRDLLGGLAEYPQVKATASDVELDREIGRPSRWEVQYLNEDASQAILVILDRVSGEMVAYYHQDQSGAPRTTMQVSTERAKEIAADFLKRAMPQTGTVTVHAERIINAQVPGEESGTAFQFMQVVDGVLFDKNTVEVGVDRGGRVMFANCSYLFDASRLPMGSLAMRHEQAKEALLRHVPLRLVIKPEHQGSVTTGDPLRILAYLPHTVKGVDAISGQVVTGYSEMVPTKDRITVNGKGQLPVVKSDADVQRVAGEVLQLDLSGYQVQKLTIDEQMPLSGQVHAWRLARDLDSYMVVTLAKTGEVVSLGRESGKPDAEGEPVLTKEQGQERALMFLTNALPPGLHEVTVEERSFDSLIPAPAWYDPAKEPVGAAKFPVPDQYTYRFCLMREGLPVLDQQYLIDINRRTGAIEHYTVPFSAMNHLPEGQPVALSTALEAYLQTHPLQLQYTWERYMDQVAPSGQLRYVMTNEYDHDFEHIDAVTGKAVYYEDDME